MTKKTKSPDTVKVIFHGEFNTKIDVKYKDRDGNMQTRKEMKRVKGGKLFGFDVETDKPFAVPADHPKLADWAQSAYFTVDGKRYAAQAD